VTTSRRQRTRLSNSLSRRTFLGLGAAIALAPAATAAEDRRLRVLAKTFRGQILTAGSSAYERARVPYNLNYASVRPLAVVRPVDAADVATVVRWAAKEHVPIVARSGGHSYGGYSTTRGVVVDLGLLSRVTVSGNKAVIGAGARLGNVFATLAQHGLAVPAGTCPSVGVGGHALGGGFGLSSRAWGLLCDNVLTAQIVTADGSVHSVDAKRHSDLYWACRGGGGGNFGIVTRFVTRTHHVSAGSYFVASYPWSQVEEVVAGFLAWAPTMADGVGALCRLAAGGTPTVQVFGQFLGPSNELQSLLASLRPAASSLVLAPSSWLDLVARWAGCLGHSLPGCAVPVDTAFAGSSSYIARIPSSSQLALFREAIEERGAQSGALLIDAYGGAINRIAPTATAFAHRRALASVQYFAAGGTSARSWVSQARAQLAPAMNGDAYVNYIDPRLPDALQAYYGANLPRLRKVKHRYDPDNLFHFAQSVK
jgi:FAD/FMN-containing dehydrogenase